MTDNRKHERYDGAALEQDLTLEADVAIVGTGAGGGVAAEILSAAGYRVVMLEEGGHFQARDFTLSEADAYPDLYQESAARMTRDKGIQILQGRSVGGSTTVNWTSSFRTPGHTLEHWASVHSVAEAMPEDMAPWFDLMERRLNIQRWDEVPPNANNRLLLDACSKLGFKADLISRNVRDCQNLGYCGMGCPVNAKQSMLVTTIPAALNSGAALVSRVRVERLTLSGGRVVGVEGVALDGHGVFAQGAKIRVRASQVVLAAGAIGSPAILLRSAPPGESGLTGKRTFLHPVVAVSGLMKELVVPFYGAPQSAYSDHFLWPGGKASGAKAGFKIEAAPMHPVLAAANFKRHGADHTRFIRRLPNLHSLIALMRDGFSEHSQGGSVAVRDDGSPVLDYPIGDYLWDGMRRAYLTMAEMQFAAGAEAVVPLHLDAKAYRSWAEAKAAIAVLPMAVLKTQVFSAHVMGGCAMGEDPTNSVVDSFGRHHRLENLTVIDGSLFPTSLGANPQVTIYALAARNARKLLESMS